METIINGEPLITIALDKLETKVISEIINTVRNDHKNENLMTVFKENNLCIYEIPDIPKNFNEQYDFDGSGGCPNSGSPLVAYINNIQNKNIDLFIELLRPLSDKDDIFYSGELSLEYQDEEDGGDPYITLVTLCYKRILIFGLKNVSKNNKDDNNE